MHKSMKHMTGSNIPEENCPVLIARCQDMTICVENNISQMLLTTKVGGGLQRCSIPQENHTIISTSCQEALIRAEGKAFNGERSAIDGIVSLDNGIEGRIQCAEQVS